MAGRSPMPCSTSARRVRRSPGKFWETMEHPLFLGDIDVCKYIIHIYIYRWYNCWYDTWDYGKFHGILRILIEYLATYEHILAPLWDKHAFLTVGIWSDSGVGIVVSLCFIAMMVGMAILGEQPPDVRWDQPPVADGLQLWIPRSRHLPQKMGVVD